MDPELSAAVERAPLSPHVRATLKGPVASARMMHINEALNDLPLCKQVWKSLGLDEHTPPPPSSGKLLYDDLSTSIHFPSEAVVYLPDSDHFSESTRFYTAIAERMRFKVQFFSEIHAAAGAEILKKNFC